MSAPHFQYHFPRRIGSKLKQKAGLPVFTQPGPALLKPLHKVSAQ
jgi:hypothetical protein